MKKRVIVLKLEAAEIERFQKTEFNAHIHKRIVQQKYTGKAGQN